MIALRTSLLLLALYPAAFGAQKWLAVASTSPSVEAAIEKVKQLRTAHRNLQVVVSSDCANLKPGLFLIAGAIANTREEAQREVTELQKSVKDAYVRACEAKPGSRVQLGVTAVDPSIFDVPSDAVNWDSADRLSEVRGAILLRRWYEKAKNDPREGRRTAVSILKAGATPPREIEADCTDAQVAISGHLAAVSCARENAGDRMLHQTKVVDIESGRVLTTVERCRKPKFPAPGTLACEAEAVGPDGALRLTPKRVALK